MAERDPRIVGKFSVIAPADTTAAALIDVYHSMDQDALISQISKLTGDRRKLLTMLKYLPRHSIWTPGFIFDWLDQVIRRLTTNHILGVYLFLSPDVRSDMWSQLRFHRPRFLPGFDLGECFRECGPSHLPGVCC